MLLKTIYISICILAATTLTFAQTGKGRRPVNKEALITALTTSKQLPLIFRDDGVFMNTELEDDNVPREVRKILSLGRSAIPLLISHLDDTRLVDMVYLSGEGEVKVTVGDVALNILEAIVKETAPMFDEECAKGERLNGENCTEADYSYVPGSYKVNRQGRRIADKDVTAAKRNWQRAFAAKKVRYVKYKY